VIAKPPDTEILRREFIPDRITVLFVGESPPAGGTFFYRANSLLYDATKEAFQTAVPDLVRGAGFLDHFRALGCYLDDLCLVPVNHPKLDNRLARAKRLLHREEGEAPLAERMREYAPRAIVVTVIGIAENVSRAAGRAGLSDLPRPALPFPGRKAHRDRFIAELASELIEFRRVGVLTPTSDV
jgi:hypothetical protein